MLLISTASSTVYELELEQNQLSLDPNLNSTSADRGIRRRRRKQENKKKKKKKRQMII